MAASAKARLTFRIGLCRTSKVYGKPPRCDHGSLSTTLSYCWGSDNNPGHLTTTATLSQHQSRIEYEKLPETLKDAFIITRKLKLRYLWIDALCIIQDSDEDWQVEAAKMGEIYRQSRVTIAASSAADSKDGCFNVRSTYQTNRFPGLISIPSVLSDGQRSTLFVLYTAARGQANQLWQIDQRPLSQRGWAFQERLLSPRILHYTSDQLFWECRQHISAEDGLCVYELGDAIENDPLPSYTAKLARIESTSEAFRPIYTWYTDCISTHYSGRVLTKPQDKLAAVAGIARLVHQATNSEYLGGIWLHELQFGLCWMVKSPGLKSPTYRCPSFSWAANDAEVEWPMAIYDMAAAPPGDFTVLDSHMEPEGLDNFGSVTNGYIEVEGQLKRALFRPRAAHSEHEHDEARNEIVDLDDDHYVYLDEEPTNEMEVFCFHLCTTQEQLPSSWMTTYMLLLSPTQNEHEYERKGLASIPDLEYCEWFDDCPRQRFRLV